MAYDPDGDPADFDEESIEDLQAWFDDPNTKALTEDLGREFRTLPADQQLLELVPEMLAARLRVNEVAGLLAGAPDDDPRWALLRALQENVAVYEARIVELGGSVD